MIEKLHKLIIGSTGFGYYEADDADPNEAGCEYSMEALKALVRPHVHEDTAAFNAKMLIREIEVTR